MTNNQIIRKAAEMAGIYTPETFIADLQQNGIKSLHPIRSTPDSSRYIHSCTQAFEAP